MNASGEALVCSGEHDSHHDNRQLCQWVETSVVLHSVWNLNDGWPE